MRFLCLPGAFGSAESYKVQLAPVVDELTSDGTCDFHFIQGQIECSPPAGFETYFGPAPHYRFVSYDGVSDGMAAIEKIRDFPEGSTSEEIMRKLFPKGQEDLTSSIRSAFNYIYEVMETQGPFEGIIGYSEGATIASSLILDEKRREEEEGRPRMLKCGVFFSGWPPISPGENSVILSDQDETYIDIPTCHVVGAGDPYLHGSLALYNVCDEETAAFFDHGKGHILPRDPRTIKELGNVIRGVVARAPSSSGITTPRSVEE